VKLIFICTKSITFNTFLKSQAEYLNKKGFKVEVACSDIENLDFKKTKHRISFPNKMLDLFNLMTYVKLYIQIKKVVKKNPLTIFYIHTPIASYLFRFFTFFDKLKIIYFVHGFRFTSRSNSIKSYFFRIVEKVLSLKISVFITINNEDYYYVKSKLLKNASLFKIKGVGLNIPNQFNKKKIKKKKLIKKILVIAAYKKEKGYFDILKVAELIKKQKIKIECFGYGNCNNFNNIKIKKKLKNISFKNFDTNLRNKINDYDILLHLSKREGLPVSLIECLSQGLPVICYDIRGNNDLIRNKFNGYFINSYKEVPNKIFYLNLEKDIYHELSINAYNSINKDYSKDKINLNVYKIIKYCSKYY
jgi:glycosyltransferase involved in cell wall biosynthesis